MRKTSKILLAYILGLGGIMLASCGGDELSKGKAESALEDQLVMFQDSSQVVSLVTGYYEENEESSRYALKKLAAVGMITYKVDLIIETRQSWYSTRKYPHYFVTVNLTEEGRKYVVSNPVTEIEDKDMENKEKEKTYPEDNVTPGDELNSILPPQEVETSSNVNENQDTTTGNDAYNLPAGGNLSSEVSEYEKAKARTSTQVYRLLSHLNKIVKIQKIYCPEEMMKKGQAGCVYIYKYKNVTPFGRILSGVREGDRFKKTATFTNYIGAGWEVSD